MTETACLLCSSHRAFLDKMQEMRDIRDATYKGKQQRMVEALTNESMHWVDMNDMDKVRGAGCVRCWI